MLLRDNWEKLLMILKSKLENVEATSIMQKLIKFFLRTTVRNRLVERTKRRKRSSILCARSTCSLRKLRIHLDLVDALLVGIILATIEAEVETTVVVLEEAVEAAAEVEAADLPLVPVANKVAVKRPSPDLESLSALEEVVAPEVVRDDLLSSTTMICSLINAFNNKLSLLIYNINLV